MPLTISTNDLFARDITKEGSASCQVQMALKGTKIYGDARGKVFTIGRGESDTGITYWSSINTNGDEIFHFANAAGNGIVSQPTVP